MIYHWIYNSFDTQQLHQPHLSFKLPLPTKTNNNQKKTVTKKFDTRFVDFIPLTLVTRAQRDWLYFADPLLIRNGTGRDASFFGGGGVPWGYQDPLGHSTTGGCFSISKTKGLGAFNCERDTLVGRSILQVLYCIRFNTFLHSISISMVLVKGPCMSNIRSSATET